MSRWVEADDLTKLEYAVAHHTNGNPLQQKQVTNLYDTVNLKTGFYHLAWGVKGLPEDYSGQEFGAMIIVVKFSQNDINFILFSYNPYRVYFGRYAYGEITWKRFTMQALESATS